MGKGKNRKSRHIFCEWNSLSFGGYNTGGIICENCNFHRSLKRRESDCNNTKLNNKVDRDSDCPTCKSNEYWYYLPPIARVPRKAANKRTWNLFWKKLKNRDFNHPSSCR